MPANLFEQELAHARAAGDRLPRKFALERLGLASWSLRDFGGSLRFFDQALSLARQLGDRHQEANLLWHQGIQYAELGQREHAIAKAEEAIALFRSMGGPRPLPTAPTCKSIAWDLSRSSPAPRV